MGKLQFYFLVVAIVILIILVYVKFFIHYKSLIKYYYEKGQSNLLTRMYSLFRAVLIFPTNDPLNQRRKINKLTYLIILLIIIISLDIVFFVK